YGRGGPAHGRRRAPHRRGRPGYGRGGPAHGRRRRGHRRRRRGGCGGGHGRHGTGSHDHGHRLGRGGGLGHRRPQVRGVTEGVELAVPAHQPVPLSIGRGRYGRDG